MEEKRDIKGRFKKIHGKARTKIYRVWCSMKERCYNKHHKSYQHYGNKGIGVCEEWKNDFGVFYEWAKINGYKEGLTIDRIDVSGDYCPENCRWVDYKIQNRNYSKNHFITYKGETLCLSDWAERFGINRATVLFRIKSGKPLSVVFSKKDYRHGK